MVQAFPYARSWPRRTLCSCPSVLRAGTSETIEHRGSSGQGVWQTNRTRCQQAVHVCDWCELGRPLFLELAASPSSAAPLAAGLGRAARNRYSATPPPPARRPPRKQTAISFRPVRPAEHPSPTGKLEPWQRRPKPGPWRAATRSVDTLPATRHAAGAPKITNRRPARPLTLVQKQARSLSSEPVRSRRILRAHAPGRATGPDWPGATASRRVTG
jgi:hypothetical protein